MIEAIADLFVAIISAIVELMVRLLTFVFSTSLIALHARGMVRFFYSVTALSALHLFAGLVLGLTGSAQGLLLSALFGKWMMLASLALLFLGIVGAVAVEAARLPDTPTPGDSVVSRIMAFVLACAAVSGRLSIWFAPSERLLKRDLRGKLRCKAEPAS